MVAISKLADTTANTLRQKIVSPNRERRIMGIFGRFLFQSSIKISEDLKPWLPLSTIIQSLHSDEAVDILLNDTLNLENI